MKRLIPLLVVLGLVLAACGESSDVAATVGDTEIPVSAVEQLAGLEGEEADPSTQAFTQSLTTLVVWEITEQAAADEFGYTPTEEEVQEQIDTVVTGAGYDSLEAMAAAEGVGEATLERYIRQLMIQDEVFASLEATVDEPTAEAISDEIAASPLSWVTVCASHILVATEEEAEAARARIEAGDDFAVVATELSTDTGSAVNGGDLGCTSASQYVEEFAVATVESPIGEVTDPVETQFGYHLIVVNDRTEATDEEVGAALAQESVGAVVDAWFLEATNSAVVVVTEGYGTWVTDPTPQIVFTAEG